MRKDLPDHFKRWLGMGGKVYFARLAGPSTSTHKHGDVIGYIRAFNRAGALRIAKAHGVTVGSVLDQRTLAGPLELIGVREIGAKEVYRGNPSSRVARRNPPLIVMGNPGRSRGKLLSKRAISIRYQHAADGELYEHKFTRGDCIELLTDGSFRIYRMDGKPLWKDFR